MWSRAIFVGLVCATGAEGVVAQELRVERVIDGDTYELSSGHVIHLIGTKAPGSEAPGDPAFRVVDGLLTPDEADSLGAITRWHAKARVIGQLVDLEWEGVIAGQV